MLKDATSNQFDFCWTPLDNYFYDPLFFSKLPFEDASWGRVSSIQSVNHQAASPSIKMEDETGNNDSTISQFFKTCWSVFQSVGDSCIGQVEKLSSYMFFGK